MSILEVVTTGATTSRPEETKERNGIIETEMFRGQGQRWDLISEGASWLVLVSLRQHEAAGHSSVGTTVHKN